MKPDNTFVVLGSKPKEYFNLIPQTGVTHLLCEDFPTHNAVWDMAISPEGRLFSVIMRSAHQSSTQLSPSFRTAESSQQHTQLLPHPFIPHGCPMNMQTISGKAIPARIFS